MMQEYNQNAAEIERKRASLFKTSLEIQKAQSGQSWTGER